MSLKNACCVTIASALELQVRENQLYDIKKFKVTWVQNREKKINCLK